LIKVVKSKGFDASLPNKNNEDIQKKEMIFYRNKLLLSLVFAIPTFVIGMVFMWIGIMIPFQDYILCKDILSL